MNSSKSPVSGFQRVYLHPSIIPASVMRMKQTKIPPDQSASCHLPRSHDEVSSKTHGICCFDHYSPKVVFQHVINIRRQTSWGNSWLSSCSNSVIQEFHIELLPHSSLYFLYIHTFIPFCPSRNPVSAFISLEVVQFVIVLPIL